MAGVKRAGVRQAFMKRSFMRSRTTAICDCWLDPLAGARSVSRKGDLRHLPESESASRLNWPWTKIARNLTIRRFDCTKRTFEKFIRKRDRVFTLSRFFAT